MPAESCGARTQERNFQGTPEVPYHFLILNFNSSFKTVWTLAAGCVIMLAKVVTVARHGLGGTLCFLLRLFGRFRYSNFPGAQPPAAASGAAASIVSIDL